jgi:putative transposase
MTSPGGLSLKEAGRGLRLQRRLARAARGSNRRRKVKALIGQLKSRAGDRRKDWAQKTSTDLPAGFDVIRLENLNVKAMTRSARGTVANPGRDVAQKAGLIRGHPQIRLGSARGPVGAEGARSGRESQSCVHVADL